jgi:hypothetical protein
VAKTRKLKKIQKKTDENTKDKRKQMNVLRLLTKHGYQSRADFEQRKGCFCSLTFMDQESRVHFF